MTLTLTENPGYAKHYLDELSRGLSDSCWEVRCTILTPLKGCAKSLQPFHVTQRGRDALATLHEIIERIEGMTTHWETKSREIAEVLRGEREYKLHGVLEELIAIG